MEEEMKEGGNQNLRKRLRIGPSALKEVNQFLLDPRQSCHQWIASCCGKVWDTGRDQCQGPESSEAFQSSQKASGDEIPLPQRSGMAHG